MTEARAWLAVIPSASLRPGLFTPAKDEFMKDENDKDTQGPNGAELNDKAFLDTVLGIIRAALDNSTDLTSRDKLKISRSVITIDQHTERGQVVLSVAGLLTAQQDMLPLWLLRFFQNTLTLAPNLELLPESSEEDRRKALLWINDRADREDVSRKDDAALTLHAASNWSREVLPADVIQLATSLLTAALAEGEKGVAADE